MTQPFSSGESRRRNLRIILFVIILATLPFYCIGFVLWGTAPQNPGQVAATSTPTLPPNTLEATITPTPNLTPSVTPTTDDGPLLPTPTQSIINPPPVLPTRFLSPTPEIQPTVLMPTRTPLPSLTPIPPPTDTVIPFFPTDTDTPTPTAP